jgi:hypothetical protein
VGRSRKKWKDSSRKRPEALSLEVAVVVIVADNDDDDEKLFRNPLYLSFHTVLASQS